MVVRRLHKMLGKGANNHFLYVRAQQISLHRPLLGSAQMCAPAAVTHTLCTVHYRATP